MSWSVSAGRGSGRARAPEGRQALAALKPAGDRVVCAPNAFKGTMTADVAAAAMAAGVRDSGLAASEVPVADGGDGTLDVLLAAAAAARVTHHEVAGPLGSPLRARLGWTSDTEAVVELAEAAGLRRLSGPASALQATSLGAGQLIVAALAGGAERILVGVGGSACTDGGAGLLQALGALLTDAGGRPVGRGGQALAALHHIDMSPVSAALARVTVDVAVDVRNPLLGPDGAAAVFGPQKGASPDDIELLERALATLADVAERDLGAAGLADLPGAGAAGGCGFALALAGAALRSGAELICDEVDLDGSLAGAALVLTGEGRLDAQTAFGKAPAEVAERARRAGVRCAAVAGQVADPLGGLFDAAYSLEELAGRVRARANATEATRSASARAVRDLLGAQ